jgi:formate dehydrogenase subunit delta
MRHDDLVRMVNQICDFFAAYPDDEAVIGVQDHLQRFWDPSMRKQLLDARAELSERLHPLARDAIERLAREVAP